MKQYKKNLTLAILFIIKYLVAWYLAFIMLKFIENNHLGNTTSFLCGAFLYSFVYGFFDGFFAKISNNICNPKNIILTIKLIKSRFSKQDYKDLKLTKVEFYPFNFAMKDDFAIKIAKVCIKISPEDKESRETLEQAIHYSRSTIILHPDKGLQRVFFETEKDLENFLIYCII